MPTMQGTDSQTNVSQHHLMALYKIGGAGITNKNDSSSIQGGTE